MHRGVRPSSLWACGAGAGRGRQAVGACGAAGGRCCPACLHGHSTPIYMRTRAPQAQASPRHCRAAAEQRAADSRSSAAHTANSKCRPSVSPDIGPTPGFARLRQHPACLGVCHRWAGLLLDEGLWRCRWLLVGGRQAVGRALQLMAGAPLRACTAIALPDLHAHALPQAQASARRRRRGVSTVAGAGRKMQKAAQRTANSKCRPSVSAA
jgi:hypothetical protein